MIQRFEFGKLVVIISAVLIPLWASTLPSSLVSMVSAVNRSLIDGRLPDGTVIQEHNDYKDYAWKAFKRNAVRSGLINLLLAIIPFSLTIASFVKQETPRSVSVTALIFTLAALVVGSVCGYLATEQILLRTFSG